MANTLSLRIDALGYWAPLSGRPSCGVAVKSCADIPQPAMERSVTTMGDGFSRGPVLGRSVTLFSFWVHELERIMQKWDATHGNLPYRLPLADSTGLECWQEAFDDGMSPQEAFDEDRHCWK